MAGIVRGMASPAESELRNLDTMLHDDEVERVLVVTAHPDDVDFGAAGTVATWTTAGIEVVYCIVTDGDAGGFDPDIPRSAIAGIRRDEQTRAAKEVGVDRLVFLGYPDGRVEATLGLRRDISRVIRQVRPQRVRAADRRSATTHGSTPATPTTWRPGEAALCAVYPDCAQPLHVHRAARGGGARGVDRSRGLDDGRTRRPPTPSTSPIRSTARWRRCCATRASTRTRPASRRWSGAG